MPGFECRHIVGRRLGRDAARAGKGGRRVLEPLGDARQMGAEELIRLFRGGLGADPVLAARPSASGRLGVAPLGRPAAVSASRNPLGRLGGAGGATW